MKQYHVTLGGQERRLRFTSTDGITLYKRLGITFAVAIRQIMTYQRGPDDKWVPNPELGMDFGALVVLLGIGLNHDDPTITEQKAGDLLDSFLAEGRSAWEVALIVQRAAFYSGLVTGRSRDTEKEAEEASGAEGGKETPTPEVPEAAHVS